MRKIFYLMIAILILVAGVTSGKSSEPAERKEIPDEVLKAEGVGAISVMVPTADVDIFVVPYNKGIGFGKESRKQLRDALLEASPVQKGKRLTLKPGKYVIGARKLLPRDSEVLYDLGGKAPGNLLIAPSKDSGYELVVGGGIRAGALFKSVEDVYWTYGGYFFAESSRTPNQKNIAKYDYLRVQGSKDLMFRFVKGKPDFELWLLSECEIKPGILLEVEIKVPGD